MAGARTVTGKEIAQLLAVGSATTAIGMGVVVGLDPDIMTTDRTDVLRVVGLSIAVFGFATHLLRRAS